MASAFAFASFASRSASASAFFFSTCTASMATFALSSAPAYDAPNAPRVSVFSYGVGMAVDFAS